MNEVLELINQPYFLQKVLNLIGLFSIVFALFHSFTTAWLIMFILPGVFFFYGFKETVIRIVKCFTPVLILAIISHMCYIVGKFYKMDVNFELGYTFGNHLVKAIGEIFPKMYLPLAFFWTIQIIWGVYFKNKPKDS